MMRNTCCLAILLLAATAHALGVSASLELVAENQTTNPAIFDGVFDVYHLVVDNNFDDVTAFDLTLEADNLIHPSGDLESSDRLLSPTPGFLLEVIPDSFFVTNGVEFTLAFDANQQDGLNGIVATPGGTPLINLGAIDQVIAVLAVEAGSPTPNVANFGGQAIVPVFGPIPPTGIPGDLDNDGDVDILELDTLGAIFPPETSAPSFADLNEDGVFDAADLAIISANFTRSGPNVAVDAISFPISFSSIPGDTNADGVVDLVDLDTLGANFGVTNTPGGAAIGDFDADGDVDLLDLEPIGFGFSGPGNGFPTPEPATAALLAAAALASWTRRQPPA